MKYMITNSTTKATWDKILLDIDSGDTPEIHCRNLDDSTITKVAGLGLPVNVNLCPSSRSFLYTVVESLKLHCVEDIILSFPVDAHSQSVVYIFIGEVQEDQRLQDCTIAFTEVGRYEISSNHRLSQTYWNTLTVHCLDHNIKVDWNANIDRYNMYLRVIND